MSADRGAPSFGTALRDARERRGVSLRQIATVTKISVSSLEALERNDLSRLPGGIIGRSFVRSYASQIGLDPEATIHQFLAQFPNDTAVAAGHPTADRVEDRLAVQSERRSAGTFVWLATLSVPVATALMYFASSGRDAARQVAKAADRLTIELGVRRPCWLSATVDGRKRIDRLLQPGERETIDVRRELVLTTADASAVTLTLNGAAARPLGQTGQAVTARFNPTNFKQHLQAR